MDTGRNHPQFVVLVYGLYPATNRLDHGYLAGTARIRGYESAKHVCIRARFDIWIIYFHGTNFSRNLRNKPDWLL